MEQLAGEWLEQGETATKVQASFEQDPALRDPRRSVGTLRLDPSYGFPHTLASGIPGISDSSETIEVEYFQPDGT